MNPYLANLFGKEMSFSGDLLANLAETAAVIVGALIINRLVVRFVLARISKSTYRYNTQKVFAYSSFFLTLLLIGRIWYSGFSSLATFLGLFSAGIAIALKDPVANFAGWIFILARHPFQVGDRLEVDGHDGDVIDIGLFSFKLLEIGAWVDADQTTGRVVLIPNGFVFRMTQTNYDKALPFVWNEVSIVVTYDSDWERAKARFSVLADAHGQKVVARAKRHLQQAEHGYLLVFPDLEPRVITEPDKNGIKLTVRYLCGSHNRRRTAERLFEDMLRAVRDEKGVRFAHQSMRLLPSDEKKIE